MRRGNYIFLLTLMCSYAVAQVQEWSYGFTLGPNLTVVGLTSDRDVFNSEVDMKPFVGGQANFVARNTIRTKHILDGWLGFTMKSHRNDEKVRLTSTANDLEGRLISKTVLNSYLGFGISYSYQITDLVAFGTGLTANFLLSSKTNFKDSELSLNNHYFKTGQMYIPFVLSYQIDRILLNIRADKGIMNRLNQSLIRERENTIFLEIGYLFGGKKNDKLAHDETKPLE